MKKMLDCFFFLFELLVILALFEIFKRCPVVFNHHVTIQNILFLQNEAGKLRVTFRSDSLLAFANMSTPEAARPPPKPELKLKPQIPSKPGTNTSHTPVTDKDTVNKNSSKVHEIVSKFNHHDAQPPVAGPANEQERKKKTKRAPTLKPKPKTRGPSGVAAEQAPPLPLKRRQSQRKDAEQNSCTVSRDVTDDQRSGRVLTHTNTRTRTVSSPLQHDLLCSVFTSLNVTASFKINKNLSHNSSRY